MKKTKITAVIVAVCILLTTIACTVTAGAEVTNSQGKLSPQLIEEINESAEETVCVYISLLPCTSEAEIEKIVREKYTWATEDEYLSYYRRELSNVVGAYVHEFIDNNSELLGEIIMIPNCVEFVIAKTSKDFIIELAKQDIVNEIDYWDEMSESNDDEFDSFYQNNFIDWSVFKYGKECLAEGYRYDELYKHFTEDENDWVLIDAEYFLDQPAVETWIHIGGRKIFSGSLCAPFKCCYGIYDVKENCFYDLDELSDNYSKYAGLIETLEALEIGKPTGDANLDNTVSISDVTCIQGMLAEYDQFTEYQNGLSDVNKDSKVNIADATDIQRYLAQWITDFDR